MLGAHGLQKLFGWWGGSGVTGLRNSLSDVGHQLAAGTDVGQDVGVLVADVGQ
ncbi:hypothetical protein MAHJHV33_50110 [Mycobacterium avium subsp. hominissuis]